MSIPKPPEPFQQKAKQLGHSSKGRGEVDRENTWRPHPDPEKRKKFEINLNGRLRTLPGA